MDACVCKNKLGDVFESIVGAIYQSHGMKKTIQFVTQAINLHDNKCDDVYLSKGLI